MAAYELEAIHEAHELGLGEGEGAAPLWKAAYPAGEGEGEAEAEAGAEAEAFIFPLLPLAAKFLLPKVASFAAKKALPFAMKHVLPRLTRGAVQVTRQLRQNPSTRPLVRTMPTIARRTVADIARQVERGRPVTPDMATRFLAREARRVLDDPNQAVQAYRQARALHRRYHHVCGPRETRGT